MRGIVTAALACAACNQAFGLGGAELVDIDASLALPDMDVDGRDDFHDNCPMDANAEQLDHDHDLVGDVCDNCPLISNPSQEKTGDDDTVGDACDPHPTVVGDCLLLFDTFTNPAAFDPNWMIIEDAANPTGVTVSAGGIVLAPPVASTTVAIVERNLTGRLAVEAEAEVDRMDTTNVTAALSGAGATLGYQCVRQGSLVGAGTPTGTISFALSAMPIDSHILFRLGVDEVNPTLIDVGCRVDFGLAVANARLLTGGIYDGGPGMAAARIGPVPMTVTVRSIAVYRTEPDPCAPAVFR